MSFCLGNKKAIFYSMGTIMQLCQEKARETRQNIIDAKSNHTRETQWAFEACL